MSVDMTRSFAFTFCTTCGGTAIAVQKRGSGVKNGTESFSAGPETECRHGIGIESWGDNKVDNNVWDHTENIPVRKRLNHRGPLSIDVSSAWYFITICAAERCDYGRAVSMKPPPTPFMVHASAILDAARFRHMRGAWRLALFLIMPDHIHLIAHFPTITSDAAVSSKPPYRGMEYVIADFKRWLSTKYGLHFQRDFFDTRLRDDAHFAEEYDYILGNPARKGLCIAPEEWPYSIAFSCINGGIIDAALPSDAGRAVSTKPPDASDGRAVAPRPPSAEMMLEERKAI